jgi:aryl-alcohol dehydrogenase-like predicted oxidoreductase
MNYNPLGRTGLQVSNLCLGAMTFGEADENSFMHKACADEATSFAIMDRALERGINFIDTADVYGQDGLSERVMGKWFSQGEGRRDRTVLATKFRFRMADGPNGSGASRRRIMRCVEDSLTRLQTDHIDLYQIHMQDVETPEHEILRALDDLVRQGKVLYIGCSNYAAYRLVDSIWLSRTQNLERFVSLQAQYSLLVRDLEREHIPACQKLGLGLLPWSPLAGGFLSGKYTRGSDAPAGTRLAQDGRLARYDSERNWTILGAVQQVAKEVDASPAQVSLAWLLTRPAVTSVIFGARTIEQLDANLDAAALQLSEEQVAVLDEASALEVGYPYDFMHRVQGRW